MIEICLDRAVKGNYNASRVQLYRNGLITKKEYENRQVSFEPMLNLGRIDVEYDAPNRCDFLDKVYLASLRRGMPDMKPDEIDCRNSFGDAIIDVIDKRVQAGEGVRIWYDDSSKHLCALYYLVHRYRKAPLFIHKMPILPRKIFMMDGEKVCGCDHLPMMREILNPQQSDKETIAEYCNIWEQLKKENAVLRIYKDGKIQSKAEDYYDEIIINGLEQGIEPIHISREFIFEIGSDYFIYRAEVLKRNRRQ